MGTEYSAEEVLGSALLSKTRRYVNLPPLESYGMHRFPMRRAGGGRPVEVMELHALEGHATPESMSITQDTCTPEVMRQSRWHGRFLERHHEIAYRRWHSVQWIPRLQLLLMICSFHGLISFILGTAGGVALKASMMRAYPDRAWLLIFTRVLGSLLPMFTSVALCSRRVRDVIVARRLYQGIPLCIIMIFALLEACPTVWLAAQHVQRCTRALRSATAKASPMGPARAWPPPLEPPPPVRVWVRVSGPR